MKVKQIHIDLSDSLAWKWKASEIKDVLDRSDEVADLTYDDGHLLGLALTYSDDKAGAAVLDVLFNYFEEKNGAYDSKGEKTYDYIAARKKLYDVLQKKVIPQWGISPESQAIFDKHFPEPSDTDIDEELNPEDFANISDEDAKALHSDEELPDHQNLEEPSPRHSDSGAELSITGSDAETPSKAAALAEHNEDSIDKPYNSYEHTSDITGRSNSDNSDLE